MILQKNLGRLTNLATAASITATLFLSTSNAFAASPCLLTPAELQSATGRAFIEGQETKTAVGDPLCVYAEQARPQRKLTIEVTTNKASQRFDSRIRLLQMGKDPITLSGVGDRAYYNGTAAGVLSGERMIAIGQLRRSSDPKISADKVAQLLRSALD